MRVDILKESGFCGGVNRAIFILDKAIKEHEGEQIYLLGEIVHNKKVNDKYINKGVKIISINELDSIPDNAIVISSAHGISDKLRERLKRFNLIDSTCPFVRRNQLMIKEKSMDNIIFIGKKGHAETLAMTEDNDKILLIEKPEDLNDFESIREGYVFNQTTVNMDNLSVIHDRIKVKAPKYKIINTMCETTKKIQSTLHKKDDKHNMIIIVGDKHSSNACSLYEMSPIDRTYFIQSEKDLEDIAITRFDNILIIGSASTPKGDLEDVKKAIKEIQSSFLSTN